MNALEIKDLTKSFPGFTLDRLNLTLPSGGIDIPAQGYIQHKKILPLYSVYLKNQTGYANN